MDNRKAKCCYGNEDCPICPKISQVDVMKELASYDIECPIKELEGVIKLFDLVKIDSALQKIIQEGFDL